MGNAQALGHPRDGCRLGGTLGATLGKAVAELTAVGIYVKYWWPDFPTWATAAKMSAR